MPAIDPSERVALLAKGMTLVRADIDEHYDEVFYEVVERIDARGSVGKGDIAMLTVWKRLRANTTWVKGLLAKPERHHPEADGTGRASCSYR